MSRMKTFFTYAIIIVAFYFLSNLLIYLFLKGTYKDISGEIVDDNIQVVQAKATYVNGYIDGNITNNTPETIMKKYIKIDIYSQRDVCLGTKYVEIANLPSGENMDFHMGYKFTDSYRYKVSIVDDISQVAEEQFLSDEVAWYAVATTIIILMFV